MSVFEGIVVLNYRLIRKIGEGGFGTVYLAEHESLGRKSAVKILHPEFARHAQLVERFFNEAKAVCAIGHRSIIDVQNVGHLETGEPFYLMEYFPGEALSDFIVRQGPLSFEQLELIMSPVVSALNAAHAKKIIHRDLKPENIMVLEDDAGKIVDVKLLDFGIAKLSDASEINGTKTGTAMGTPQFMAPEQAKDSKSVDVRADVYSFGATVFNCLAGHPPFSASNITDLIIKIHTEPAPRLGTVNSEISATIQDAVDQCLRKTPEERPDSIEEAWLRLLEADRTSASGNTVDSGSQAPSKQESRGKKVALAATVVSGERQDTVGVAAESHSAEGARKGRAWLWAGGLLLLLGACGLTVALWSGREPPKRPTSTTESTMPASTAPPVQPVVVVPADAALVAVNAVLDAGSADAGITKEEKVEKKPVALVAKKERPECSIYEFLTIKDKPQTLRATERQLKDFRRCHRDGLISDGKFRQIRESLTKTIGRLKEPASPLPLVAKSKPGLSLTIRLPGGKRQAGRIVFKTASARLANGVPAILQQAAEEASSVGGRVVIEVHSDSMGRDSSNLQLTQDRAEALKEIFIGAGVGKGLIRAKGIGEARPIGDNSSSAGRSANRRITVQVLAP